jgi:hypothetical protein
MKQQLKTKGAIAHLAHLAPLYVVLSLPIQLIFVEPH